MGGFSRWLLAALCFCGSVALAQQTLPTCSSHSHARCFDETCGEPLFNVDIGMPCACVAADIGYKFTDCRADNKRDLIYYWRPPAVCLGGTLPSPLFNLPCTKDDVPCGRGQYLDVTSNSTCKVCPPGKSSDPSGEIFEVFDEWPAQFHTFCSVAAGRDNCSLWHLAGDSVDSGDNFARNNVNSILELRAQIIASKGGVISFEYRVSAEDRYDGLWFIVDDTTVLSISNTLPAGEWKTYTKNLTKGPHVFQWVYHKDFSVTSGEDRAYVRKISLDGVHHDRIDCKDCPPGLYSKLDSNRRLCDYCAEGTFSLGGAGSCTPCPAGYTSHSGATECVPEAQCTVAMDAVYDLAPCRNGSQVRTWSWIQPATCNTDSRPALPAPVSLGCMAPLCDPGTQLASGAECETCQPGYATPGMSQPCVGCNAGEATLFRRGVYEHWAGQNWEAGWETFANRGPTWRRAGHFLDTAGFNPPNSESWLRFTAEMFDYGDVYFDVQMWCPVGNSLVVSMDGVQQLEILCQGLCGTDNSDITTGRATYRIRLIKALQAPHNKLHTFEWRYVTGSVGLDNRTAGCDRALIRNITVLGVSDPTTPAGATACTQCFYGSYQNATAQGTCDECVPGTYADTLGSTACKDCPAGSVSPRTGARACIACGSGTTPFPNSTDCTFDCKNVTFGSGRAWDVSALASINMTDLVDSYYNNETLVYSFHLAVCARNPECGQTASYGCMNNHTLQRLKDENAYTYLDFGDFISFTPAADDTYVNISIFDGWEVATAVGQPQRVACNARIQVFCDPVRTVAEPVITDLKLPLGADGKANSQECYFELAWMSTSGCRMCLETDFERLIGECTTDSERRISYFKKTPLCIGGFAPQEGFEPCEPTVEVGASSAAGAIVITVIVLLAVMAIMVVLVVKNRQISHEYEALQQSHIPLSENEFDSGSRRPGHTSSPSESESDHISLEDSRD